MPHIDNRGLRSTQHFKDTRTRLYNSCLEALFQSMCAAYDAGGFYLLVLGELRYFVPVVAFFCQDSKEGDLLCGKYGAWNTAFPCRICMTEFKDMNNPDSPACK